MAGKKSGATAEAAETPQILVLDENLSVEELRVLLHEKAALIVVLESQNAELKALVDEKESIIKVLHESTTELEEKLKNAIKNIQKAEDKLNNLLQPLEVMGKRKRPLLKAIRALGKVIILTREVVKLKNGIHFDDLSEAEKQEVLRLNPTAFEDIEDDEPDSLTV